MFDQIRSQYVSAMSDAVQICVRSPKDSFFIISVMLTFGRNKDGNEDYPKEDLSIRFQILIPLVVTIVAGFGTAALVGYQAMTGQSKVEQVVQQAFEAKMLARRTDQQFKDMTALVDRVVAGEFPIALNIFAHHPLISRAKGARVDPGSWPRCRAPPGP